MCIYPHLGARHAHAVVIDEAEHDSYIYAHCMHIYMLSNLFSMHYSILAPAFLTPRCTSRPVYPNYPTVSTTTC